MTQFNPNKGNVLEENIVHLLGVLDNRSHDIIVRRYGLNSGQVETLDSIGQEYGITRERVRQIEAQAKKSLAKRHDVLDVIALVLNTVFAEHGGILAENHIIELVNLNTTNTAKSSVVIFYLDIMPLYQRHKGTDLFGPHWYHLNVHNQYADEVILAATRLLKKAKQPLKEEDLISKIRNEIKIDESVLTNSCIYALLLASKDIQKTVFGEWGLADWVDTSPRGVGDKAYIVLRRHGHPMHFREITKQINEVKFDHKRAHEQTVHNELIKDERFVLVGRGLYALQDWGYTPGTVADVLESILAKSQEPLTREEILKRVLEQRVVKKTTVLLGLHNNKRFQKQSDNHYTLRKS